MNKMKKNLFSPTPSVVKRGTVAMLCLILTGLFWVAGCKKDDKKEDSYPRDIPFTEYSLEICQWTNLAYDDKVILINSDEELENYIICTDENYSKIDFLEYSLLLARGVSSNGIRHIDINFSKDTVNEYALNVIIHKDLTTVAQPWLISIITPKIGNEATIILNVQQTTYGGEEGVKN